MMTRTAYRWMTSLGLDPRAFYTAIRNLPRLIVDFRNLRKELSKDWPLQFNNPRLTDFHSDAGTGSGHYFHQDLYVSQAVYKHNPVVHLDIGSRIDGFVAHIATFRKIKVADIRPLNAHVPNIEFVQIDLSSKNVALPAVDSVSCLHALEHFGLGRYGDNISADAWRDGLNNLTTLVNPGGRLYLSVPIGRQRIEFNAHRVFAPSTILNATAALGLKLQEFAYVDDRGDLHTGAQQHCDIVQLERTLRYGLGIFTFERAPS